MFREHVIECHQRRLGLGANREVGAASADLSGDYQRGIRDSHRHRCSVDERIGIRGITPATTASVEAPRGHVSDAQTRTITIIFCSMVPRRIPHYASGGRSVLTPQIILPQRPPIR